MKNFTTFTVNIDEDLDLLLLKMKEQMKMGSKVDVFRMAITILKIGLDARNENPKNYLAVIRDDQVMRKIFLPPDTPDKE